MKTVGTGHHRMIRWVKSTTTGSSSPLEKPQKQPTNTRRKTKSDQIFTKFDEFLTKEMPWHAKSISKRFSKKNQELVIKFIDFGKNMGFSPSSNSG
jgi:hypothetical protein